MHLLLHRTVNSKAASEGHSEAQQMGRRHGNDVQQVRRAVSSDM